LRTRECKREPSYVLMRAHVPNTELVGIPAPPDALMTTRSMGSACGGRYKRCLRQVFLCHRGLARQAFFCLSSCVQSRGVSTQWQLLQSFVLSLEHLCERVRVCPGPGAAIGSRWIPVVEPGDVGRAWPRVWRSCPRRAPCVRTAYVTLTGFLWMVGGWLQVPRIRIITSGSIFVGGRGRSSRSVVGKGRLLRRSGKTWRWCGDRGWCIACIIVGRW